MENETSALLSAAAGSDDQSNIKIQAPPYFSGWIKKKARSGLIKNWQRRYMVLDSGLIQYFEGYDEKTKLPQNCKGTLRLFNALLDDKNVDSSLQLYVVGGEDELGIATLCRIKYYSIQ
jgi:hypothetical protein